MLSRRLDRVLRVSHRSPENAIAPGRIDLDHLPARSALEYGNAYDPACRIPLRGNAGCRLRWPQPRGGARHRSPRHPLVGTLLGPLRHPAPYRDADPSRCALYVFCAGLRRAMPSRDRARDRRRRLRSCRARLPARGLGPRRGGGDKVAAPDRRHPSGSAWQAGPGLALAVGKEDREHDACTQGHGVYLRFERQGLRPALPPALWQRQGRLHPRAAEQHLQPRRLPVLQVQLYATLRSAGAVEVRI